MKLGEMSPNYLYYVGARILDIYTWGKYQPLDIMLGKHPSMGLIPKILSF